MRLPSTALALLISTASFAYAQLPSFDGRWVLDQDRSTFEPLSNRPSRRVITIAIKGDSLTQTTETERIEITPVEPFQEITTAKVTYTARFDGREYPVPNSNAKVRVKRINATSFERSAVTTTAANETATWSLAPDGKTLTITTMGLDEYRMNYSSVQVYRRQ
jgi:hypothetical protein